MVASFSSSLGYSHLTALLELFGTRILFGVQKELLELVRLHPLLQQSQRARQLYALGLRSPTDIAHADPRTLAKQLRQLVPFEVTSSGHPMASTAKPKAMCRRGRLRAARSPNWRPLRYW